MSERDNTNPRFGNWRIIPRPEDGRIHIQGYSNKPLVSLTATAARELAAVLVLAAHKLEMEIA